MWLHNPCLLVGTKQYCGTRELGGGGGGGTETSQQDLCQWHNLQPPISPLRMGLAYSLHRDERILRGPLLLRVHVRVVCGYRICNPPVQISAPPFPPCLQIVGCSGVERCRKGKLIRTDEAVTEICI